MLNKIRQIFARFWPNFAGFSQLGPGEMYADPQGPGGLPDRVPAVCIFAVSASHTAPPLSLAHAAARHGRLQRGRSAPRRRSVRRRGPGGCTAGRRYPLRQAQRSASLTPNQILNSRQSGFLFLFRARRRGFCFFLKFLFPLFSFIELG